MTDTMDLRELIDSVLSSHAGEALEHELTPAWKTFVKLGLPAVGVSEVAGGSGGTLTDVTALVEAVAERGVSCPLIESTVANWVLARSGTAMGGLTTVVIVDDELDLVDGLLSGDLSSVPWARLARSLVVFGLGTSFVVDLADPSVVVEPGENVAGEPRDTVRLAKYPVEYLNDGPDRDLVRARLGLLWSVAILGAATGAYQLTRSYVSEREQFGKPLVRIPAVMNGLATMRVHLLQVQAGIDRALGQWKYDPDPSACLAAASVARIIAASAASEVATLAHQLHGAIGITEEYALHPLTRRLWAWRDTEVPEHEWARRLGRVVLAFGEQALWDNISA
ncbi:acyl-CoA dehydrogenase family protein [Nocardia neocaledoniensis]|uniref:acyl-CoA dehydrogenase family protein n=1 Tax=Nocardia neocaledoniensis TaxID=236511 RepID=UPI00245864B3|nr:acyl-CoA dehydrogenase family protein [Nocardia neocaledoniensis]